MKQLYFHLLLLKRLAVLLFVYSILRLIFFLFNLNIFYENMPHTLLSFFAGLRFDISAIVYINLLIIALYIVPFNIRFKNWYQKTLNILFYVFNIPAIILAVADIEFYKFNSKRISSDLFGLSGVFFKMLPHYLINYWYLLVVIIGVTYLLITISKGTQVSKERLNLNFFLQFLLLIFFGALTIIAMRGGTQKHPLSPLAACRYTDISKIALITNTPFEFIHSVLQRGIERKNYFSNETCNEMFSIVKQFRHRENFKKDNIIIIILESFSKELVGALNGKNESLTPFLDSLIGSSLTFTNAHANGWRSMQAIVSVTSGIPALMEEPFMYSKYQNDKIFGLGTILKNEGYTTSFFHGGDNGEFRFDWYSKAAGFEHYYGRNEFNNESEFDGGYGIYDEPFFQFFANEQDRLNEPFCSVIFSLSSHDPYHIPSKYKNKFSKGHEEIAESIGYTDFSLRQFFRTAQTKKWFANTLFVITADHVHQKTHSFYQDNTNDFFSVPILFYKSNSNLKGFVNYPVQQVDILPSILDYLNYNGRFITFGKSVFDSTGTRYVYQYLNGVYYITDNNYTLLFNGNNTMGLYKFLSKENLEQLPVFVEDRNRLENKIKAVIQTYNNSLINNKLSVE